MDKLIQHAWIPPKPFQYVFFDVDSTLSAIEGIDVLANWNHVGEEVAAITEQCMSKTGMNPKAYQYRLDKVKPTLQQINELSELYIQQLTPGAKEVIAILHQLGKTPFIISAGLKQALIPLAHHLSIPLAHTFAVDIYFDEMGNYHHFDNTSLLAKKQGKSSIIEQACPTRDTVLLIGDGLSDLEAEGVVSRFVGFGGHCLRENVQKASEFYIKTPHLYALLPLLLTANEVEKLNQQASNLYMKGLTAIQTNQVIMKELGNVQN
jgi:phosphoserine phosphatase